LDAEKRAAIREFLTYFLKKREEIIGKIEDLTRLPDLVQQTHHEENRASDSSLKVGFSLPLIPDVAEQHEKKQLQP